MKSLKKRKKERKLVEIFEQVFEERNYNGNGSEKDRKEERFPRRSK